MRTTFEQWMKQVDEWVGRLCGMSAYDLADICYADLWEDGESPKQAARKAIRNEMGED